MNRSWLRVFGLALVVGAGVGYAHSAVAAQNQPAPVVQPTLQIQGSVVQTTPDHFIVQSADNKRFTVHVNPQTKYLQNKQVVQYSTLRPGSNISVVYTMSGTQYLADTVTFVPATPVQSPAPAPQPPQQQPQPQQPPAQPQAVQQLLLQGRITQTAPDHIVLQTADNKQMTVQVNPQTKYLLDNKVVRYSDLRVGSDISIVYVVQGNQHLATTVTVGVAQPPAQPEAKPLEGQVVRVIGKDQVVIRTSDNKEITVYVNPQTSYLFNNQPGQFSSVQPGVPIQVYYDMRDKRPVARRILGGPRR